MLLAGMSSPHPTPQSVQIVHACLTPEAVGALEGACVCLKPLAAGMRRGPGAGWPWPSTVWLGQGQPERSVVPKAWALGDLRLVGPAG